MQMTIDRAGRMVLPKAIRDDLGLEPGDSMEATVERDAVVLRPTGHGGMFGRKGRTLVFRGKAVGDIAQAVERHRDERARMLMGARGGA